MRKAVKPLGTYVDTETKARSACVYLTCNSERTTGSMDATEFDRERVLAVILARGGSRGIPRKNVRVLAGSPLLGRGIELLRGVESIDRVVVSTDCSEIASLALAYGADIPFLRPAVLASDEAPSLPALQHAVRYLLADGERAGTVVLFQATSPCCRAADIEAALQAFRASSAGLLKSVTPVSEHPQWMGSVGADGHLDYLTPEAERARRRQDLPPVYRLNGALTMYRTEVLMGPEPESGRPLAFVMDSESSIDLDTEEDWIAAERVLETRVTQHA